MLTARHDQIPVPPLLIGGFGPKRTLKIVAKYADWCNIYDSDLEFCRGRLEVLRDHCLTVGRDYESIVKTYICDCVAVAPTARRSRIDEASQPVFPVSTDGGHPG